MDYEGDLRIDPEQLDVEWIKQPQLYMKYAEAAAKADDIKAKAKENLDVVKAMVELRVRKSLSAAGEKITEGLVDSMMKTSQEYQDAMKRYLDAMNHHNILLAAVKAMDHKKSSLENLVRLWAGSYFAGPKEPRDLGSKAGFAESAAREMQRKKLRGE